MLISVIRKRFIRFDKMDYENIFKYAEEVYKESLNWSDEKKKYAIDNIKSIESTYTDSYQNVEVYKVR